MSMNKKVLAVAIFGALVSANAAAIEIGLTPAANPAYFAKEIVISSAAAGTTLTTTAVAPLTWAVGYAFSTDEVRYARVECSSNIKLNGVVTSTGLAGTAIFGAVNGAGTNVLTFSVTSKLTNVQAADKFVLTGNHAVTSNADVSCTTALYDQPSQAQAGGDAGKISNTVRAGKLLAFVPSYEFKTTSVASVANVEATPSFTQFVANATTGTTTAKAQLSAVTFGLADVDGTGTQNEAYKADGTKIALTDLFAATNNFSIEGDFSSAANADGSYTGAALARVQLGAASAKTLTATKATFEIGAAPQAGVALALSNRSGVTIPVSTYAATLNAVSAAPTVYAVSNIGPSASGVITRNGTELQAPLAQVPAGWLSRMVLTNTGGVARPYTIAVQGETGNTIGTDAAHLTGTVPANGTVVVDLNGVLKTFTKDPRATLNVTIAGPNNQIQGLYQIVNPTSGSISNHAMLRPGTN